MVPLGVVSVATPVVDQADEVPSHTYSLRDRSTLAPPVRFAAASTSFTGVHEPGTNREAVQSPEWQTAMTEELDVSVRT